MGSSSVAPATATAGTKETEVAEQVEAGDLSAVVKGGGKMNVDRLSARNKAWDDGEWVRDAALAHAKKQAAKKAGSALAAE